MSSVNLSRSATEATAHTVQEFISIGMQTNEYTSYNALAYIEKRNRIEFVVKQLIDDYIYELRQLMQEVQFSDKYVIKYRFNPKMLSYDLYGTTKLFYLILKLNDMCNVHEFSIANHKLNLLAPTDMKSALNSIYSSENQSMQIFNNAHKNDVIETPINKYVYVRDPIARFMNA